MLSLYVHIPYCVRKCPYCGFYSTQYNSTHVADFIAALSREASRAREAFTARSFLSVYIGGGTPSALSDQEFSEVLGIIKTNFPLSDNFEFTVEANPNTALKRDLSMWRVRGVNRLSLGVQSFSDAVLRSLGRIHTGEEAQNAFHYARSSGFQNISLDLMYGIPEQTVDQWREALDLAMGLGPEHLSIYSLSLDEGTIFKRETEAGKRSMPDDDSAADMYEYAVPVLTRAGYGRYEISNFSLPDYECRHNMNYWQRGEYLGFGPGAWSFLDGTRTRNIADVNQYIKRLNQGTTVTAESETPDIEQSSRETILLHLRTAKGLDLRKYRIEYGPQLLRNLEASVESLEEAGLLRVKEGVLTLTERGILLSNEALSRLFS
jgi:putative oxygen-independent coproporphyrinogen III oxidase